MATPPSTGYAVRSVTAGALLSDWTSLVDVSDMPAEWKALVDTSDGTKGRVFLDDGTTRLAVDPMFFDGVAVTGHYRFLIPTFSGVVPTTIRIYPPVAANDSVASGDLYGSDNAYDSAWKAYWPLDEAVNNDVDGYKDRTSNANHGQGVSMALPEVDGKVGKAQDFDGPSDLINCGTGSSLDNIFAGGGTLSGWFYADTLAGWGTVVFKGPDASNTESLIIHLDPGEGDVLVLNVDTTANQYIARSQAGSISAGQWTHFAITWDEDTSVAAICYVDAINVNMARALGSGTVVSNASYPWFIAAKGTSQKFNGRIDDIKAESTIRSADWNSEGFSQENDNSTYWGVWAWEPFTAPATFDIILADTVYIMQVASDDVVIKQLASDTVNIVQVDSDTVRL